MAALTPHWEAVTAQTRALKRYGIFIDKSWPLDAPSVTAAVDAAALGAKTDGLLLAIRAGCSGAELKA